MNDPDGPNPWGQPPEPPEPQDPKYRGPQRWLMVLGGLLGLAAMLIWLLPDALSSGGGLARLIFLIALMAMVGSGIFASRRFKWPRALKHAAAWMAIGFVLIAGYGFRFEIGLIGDRVIGELMPHSGVSSGAGSVSFRPGPGGQYRVDAVVDGTPIRFLVDTGATDVVLTLRDARRLGFDPNRLNYSKVYSTANGTVRGAPVLLGTIAIGSIRVPGVAASVNEAPMGTSLLGMTFLKRLAGYEVSGGTLTLRQ